MPGSLSPTLNALDAVDAAGRGGLAALPRWAKEEDRRVVRRLWPAAVIAAAVKEHGSRSIDGPDALVMGVALEMAIRACLTFGYSYREFDTPQTPPRWLSDLVTWVDRFTGSAAQLASLAPAEIRRGLEHEGRTCEAGRLFCHEAPRLVAVMHALQRRLSRPRTDEHHWNRKVARTMDDQAQSVGMIAAFGGRAYRSDDRRNVLDALRRMDGVLVISERPVLAMRVFSPATAAPVTTTVAG